MPTTSDTITLNIGDKITAEWMGDESMASTTIRITAIQTGPIIVLSGTQQ